MRSNGLTAEDYAPVAVLERSLSADALLALREAGVAAYAVLPQASGPDRSPGPQTAEQATVFADRTALAKARAVIAQVAPGAVAPAEVSPVDEVAWQQIVSGFSSTAPEPQHDTGTNDTADTAETDDRAARPAEPDRRRAHPPEHQPHPLVDDDEHFVPEPPPPPPRPDLLGRLGWGGVLGGPLGLLLSALASWSPPRFVLLLFAVAFVGGMVTLVLRMKDRPPTDDGPDNGAVV
jgi:hypothetical protein